MDFVSWHPALKRDTAEAATDPAREGIDWVRDDDERIMHPIYKAGRDLCHEAMDELKATARLSSEGEDKGAGEFVGQLMTLSAKLAGAFGGLARRFSRSVRKSSRSFGGIQKRHGGPGGGKESAA